MSVGVDKLDRDHQVLIDLINRIETCASDEIDQTRVLGEVIATLIAYTVFHFEREEKVMAACGYPAFAAHQEEHRVLTREVQSIQHRFATNPESIAPNELLDFLVDWLRHHILLQDMEYKPFCANTKQANEAAEAHGDFDLSVLFRSATLSTNA